jgi:hypothetical protein
MQWVWGPFHVGLEPQSLHHDNICTHAVLLDFNGFGNQGQIVSRQRQDSGFIIQSIAYEWCITPSIWMTQWMWGPCHVGLKTQPHRTMITFVAQLRHSIFQEYANLVQQVCQYRQDSGSISQSIAYEWFQTPCIWMLWVWGPIHVGLEPKQLHHDNIYTPAASPESWEYANLVHQVW